MKLPRKVLVALSAVAVVGLCQCTTTEVGSVDGAGEMADPDKRYEAAIERDFRADPSVYP